MPVVTSCVVTAEPVNTCTSCYLHTLYKPVAGSWNKACSREWGQSLYQEVGTKPVVGSGDKACSREWGQSL